MEFNLDTLHLREGTPDFQDLPWDLGVSKWRGVCPRIENLPSGISRHPFIFVNYDGALYAIKELPSESAKKEFDILLRLEELRLPAVKSVGYGFKPGSPDRSGLLITRYLDQSLPYRTLFMQSNLENYRENLLDAVAGLLVQLHLAGIYWGDCSLSNTLFRRDAGALQAYLVDIETGDYYPKIFPPTQRLYDLEIMEENINGELSDLGATGLLAENVPIDETGAYIRLRYQQLWEEITREDIIDPGEYYLIQDRIRALNSLGFSIGDVELAHTDSGDQLRLKVVVTDRNFHRDQLYNLTGLDTEEGQARQMVNEIQEMKATLSRTNNRSTPLTVGAYHWLENIYQPVVTKLEHLRDDHTTLPELYCQVLEHKWYLSEQARHDVGHNLAAEDYLRHFGINKEE